MKLPLEVATIKRIRLVYIEAYRNYSCLQRFSVLVSEVVKCRESCIFCPHSMDEVHGFQVPTKVWSLTSELSKKGCNLNLSHYWTPTWPSGCLSWRVWRAFSHCFWRPRDTTCCVLSCEHWWAVRILGLGTNLKHILPDNRTQTANPFGLRMSRCCFRSHWRWSFGTGPQNRCSNRRCQS